MRWISVKISEPIIHSLGCIDVFVCCGKETFTASYIKQPDDVIGKFYLSIDYPVKIFEDITHMVTHWMYIPELPKEK